MSWSRVSSVTLALVAILTVPGRLRAQQPLSEFLAATSSGSLDLREARAVVSQARSQVDEARGRLLPSLMATAVYQRNEPAVVVTIPSGLDSMGMPITRQAPITPADQLEARATLTVPLVDLSAWSGFFQSEALAEAADAQLESAAQTVDVTVVQLWHQLVGTRGLIRAAERSLETAIRNEAAAQARVEVGVSPQLELARAQAEVARARQTLAEARLNAVLSARSLENLTGLHPDDRQVDLTDDLEAEASLETFLARARELPAVRAVRAQQRAADIADDTAWFALLPTIAATANTRLTNASGFGPNDSYSVAITATWMLDFVRPAQLGTRAAAAEIALVRSERQLQQVETAVFEAWQRVEASRARAQAALAVLEASQRAAIDAQARYEAGAATQLDVIQAERDLFSAEVASIQATADLLVARAALRIRSGLEIDE